MHPTDLRPLGRTGLQVTALGAGGAPIGNLYHAQSDESAIAAVEASWDAGLRYFDTAPLYGFGLSEHRMGTALRARDRDAYVLSTKVGCMLEPAPPGSYSHPNWDHPLPFRPVYNYSRDAVLRSVELSLHRLGTHRIDVLYVHDLDAVTHGSEEAYQGHLAELFDGGGYQALAELRDQGVIAGFGAGLNFWENCQYLAERGDFDCFLLAGRYTLLEQEALETFLPLCEARSIGVVIGGPYNSGILAVGPTAGATYNYAPAPPEILDRVRRIQAVCEAHATPLATAALQFPLHHPAVASVIPGGRTPDQVRRNAETLAAEVPSALYAALKAEGLMRPDAPVPTA